MSSNKSKGAKAPKTKTKSASELLAKPACNVACLASAKAKKSAKKSAKPGVLARLKGLLLRLVGK